jgi:hypothetical protein
VSKSKSGISKSGDSNGTVETTGVAGVDGVTTTAGVISGVVVDTDTVEIVVVVTGVVGVEAVTIVVGDGVVVFTEGL